MPDAAIRAPAAPRTVTFAPADNQRLATLCGPCEDHLSQVERYFGVHLARLGETFTITGEAEPAAAAHAALERLYQETAQGQELSAAKVHLVLRGDAQPIDDAPEITVGRRQVVRARSGRQAAYLRNVFSHDINFAIGPAGTGKTYLAVACAVRALLDEMVQRVVLVRPAVEAGEKLGFLPGDLSQKVDPYLRPIYDALYEMLTVERTAKLIERGIIEIAPLAYMRGRTLSEAFIILDEAQNTTPEQMKMFLTRIGFGSTAVVTGDITQTDLPAGRLSGLKHVMAVLDGVEGISFNHFTARDVVRHPLVERVIAAYEHAERRPGEGNGGR